MDQSGNSESIDSHDTGESSNLKVTEMRLRGIPPQCWSKYDVQEWVIWCCQEYDLSDPPLAQFSMNGKAFCMLTREDFIKRAPHAGDLLYNTLVQYVNMSQLELNKMKSVDSNYAYDLSHGQCRKEVNHCNCCKTFDSVEINDSFPKSMNSIPQDDEPLDLSISKTKNTQQLQSKQIEIESRSQSFPLNLERPQTQQDKRTIHQLGDNGGEIANCNVSVKQEVEDIGYMKAVNASFDSGNCMAYQGESSTEGQVSRHHPLPHPPNTVSNNNGYHSAVPNGLHQYFANHKDTANNVPSMFDPQTNNMYYYDPITQTNDIGSLEATDATLLPDLLRRSQLNGSIPRLQNLIQGMQTEPTTQHQSQNNSPPPNKQYHVIRTGKRGRPRKVLIQPDGRVLPPASKNSARRRSVPPPLMLAAGHHNAMIKPFSDSANGLIKPPLAGGGYLTRHTVFTTGENVNGIEGRPIDSIHRSSIVNDGDSVTKVSLNTGERDRMCQEYNVTVQALSGGGCVVLNSGMTPKMATSSDSTSTEDRNISYSPRTKDVSVPLNVANYLLDSSSRPYHAGGSDNQKPDQTTEDLAQQTEALHRRRQQFVMPPVTLPSSDISNSSLTSPLHAPPTLEYRPTKPSVGDHSVRQHGDASNASVINSRCWKVPSPQDLYKNIGRPRKNSDGQTVFDPSTNLIKVGDQNCRLLWQFLLHALMDSNYKEYIEWADKDKLIFRIKNSDALAKCWGRQKNLPNMNYEKMSRAMRFYYKSNLIGRVPGRRLLYRFLMKPDEIRRLKSGLSPRYPKPLVPPVACSRTGSVSEIGSEASPSISVTSEADESSAVKSPGVESPGVNDLMSPTANSPFDGAFVRDPLSLEPKSPLDYGFVRDPLSPLSKSPIDGAFVRDPLSPAEDTVDDTVIDLSEEMMVIDESGNADEDEPCDMSSNQDRLYEPITP